MKPVDWAEYLSDRRDGPEVQLGGGNPSLALQACLGGRWRGLLPRAAVVPIDQTAIGPMASASAVTRMGASASSSSARVTISSLPSASHCSSVRGRGPQKTSHPLSVRMKSNIYHLVGSKPFTRPHISPVAELGKAARQRGT